MKRLKIIAISIATCLIALMFVFSVPNAWADSNDDVIYIDNESDFADFILYSAIEGYYADKEVVLQTDLYFTRKEFYSQDLSYIVNYFDGTFIGNNHALIGIDGARLSAVFGKIGKQGSVKDLRIVDAIIAKQSGSVALLAYENHGTVSNIKAEGSLISAISSGNGSDIPYGIGGLVAANFGIIKNSLVIANRLSDNSNIGGVAYYNGEDGWVENNHFIVSDESNQLLMDVSGVAYNDGEYIAAITDYYLEKDGNNCYLINDVWDILYYSKLIGNLDNAKQTQDINLYNIKNLAIADTINHVMYDKNYKGFFNNKSDYIDIINFDNNAEQVIPIINTDMQGDGSKYAPFLITDINQLQYINEIDATDKYFRLVNNLSLYDGRAYYTVHISNFDGIFDGGGKSISGVVSPLFGNNNGLIKNLSITGFISSEKPILAQYNAINAKIDNIEIKASVLDNGTDTAIMVKENNGKISNSTVTADSSSSAIAIATFNYGEISRVRNYSNLPFVYNNAGRIEASYNDNIDWSVLTQDQNPIYLSINKLSSNSFQTVGTDATIYDLVSQSGDLGKKGWEWGVPNGWGFVSGQLADVPTLVFPQDNIAYKSITNISTANRSFDYNADATYTLHDIVSYCNFTAFNEINLYELVDSQKMPLSQNTVIKNAGVYIIDGVVFANPNATAYYGSATFTIKKVRFTFEKDDFNHIDGIGSPVIYNRQEFSLNNIAPLNNILGTAYDYKITAYVGQGAAIPSTLFDAGRYTIKITASNINYDINIADSIVFVIDKKEITATPIMLSTLSYNQELTILRKEYSGLISGDTIADNATKIVSNYTIGSAVGRYWAELQASNVILKNYTILTGERAEFNVEKADIPNIDSMTFNNKAVFYNGAYHTLTVDNIDVGSSVKVDYSAVKESVSWDINKIIDVGIYTHTARIYIDDNYNEKIINANLAIRHAQLSVKASDIEIVYNTEPSGYSYSFSYELYKRADGKEDIIGGDINYQTNYHRGDNVGRYIISITGVEIANYDIIFENGELIVTQATRNISLLNAEKTYDNMPFVPQFNVLISDLPSPQLTYFDDEQIEIDAPVSMGQYILRLEYAESTNYKAGSQTFDIFIYKKQLGNIILWLNDSVSLMNNPASVGYNPGSYHKIDFDKSLLDGQDFEYLFHYIYNGDEYTDESMLLQNAGVYTNIWLEIFGNINYENKIIFAKTLTITPKVLNVRENIPSATYTSKVLTPRIELIGGESVSLIKYVAQNDGQIVDNIIYPAKYNLTISSANPNYIVGNGSITLTYTVNKARVSFDFNTVGALEFVFGQVRVENKVSIGLHKDLSFTLGDTEVTERINFVSSSSATVSYIAAGVYNIKSASNDGVDIVVVNGENKIIVLPKPLTIEWDMLDRAYPYKGAEYVFDLSIPETKFLGQKIGNNDIIARIKINNISVKNAGSYRAEITIANTNYTMDEGYKYFDFEITKANVIIDIASQIVVFGTPNTQYTATADGLLGNDTYAELMLIMASNYAVGDGVGKYDIFGEIANPNYQATINTGTINVINADFQTLSFGEKTFNYTGYPIEPSLIGVPSFAEVSFNFYPINSGFYNIVAYVSADNYNTAELSSTIEIKAVMPICNIVPRIMNYKYGIYLKSQQINGNAIFIDAKGDVVDVDGVFSYNEDYMLRYGSHEYGVSFTPNSNNFLIVDNLICKIDGQLSQAIQVELSFGQYDSTLDVIDLTKDKELIISIMDNKDIIELGAQLYVDGQHIESGAYHVDNITKEITVTIKLDGSVYLEKRIMVNAYTNLDPDPEPNPDPEPEPNPDPDPDPDNGDPAPTPIPPSKENDKLSKILVIAGLSAAVITIVSVGVALAVKTRRKRDNHSSDD